MMRLSENVYIKCNKCSHVALVERDSLECDISTYDRPMGEEIEYNFHGELCCEICNTLINFSIRGYEYPVGAFNFSDYDCNDGEFIKKPALELEYD